QLRGITLAIKNSSTIILPRWYEVLKSLLLAPCMMPRDIATHWNLTYDMLEFANEYHAALNVMTADHDMNLRKFELSKKEWTMATELCDIFKHGTLFFSCDTPNISTVIPAMDHIDEYLATASRDVKYSGAIHAALTLRKKTLNRYYDKTDHSEVYRIAMVLHPRHKLHYFK
ncbi:hypothetical protein M413DRAFT_46116, partial [Hebeloma cylindrosporum]